MNTISISRRRFAQLLGAGAAAAVVRPKFTFTAEPPPRSTTIGGVVRLSANENPYGPSPKALKAMTDAFDLACRYPDEHNNLLIRARFSIFARRHLSDRRQANWSRLIPRSKRSLTTRASMVLKSSKFR